MSFLHVFLPQFSEFGRLFGHNFEFGRHRIWALSPVYRTQNGPGSVPEMCDSSNIAEKHPALSAMSYWENQIVMSLLFCRYLVTFSPLPDDPDDPHVSRTSFIITTQGP